MPERVKEREGDIDEGKGDGRDVRENKGDRGRY